MTQEVGNLEYNTERPGLKLPEYGRHIQKMVDYAVSIEDREKRNKVVNSIIGVMGNLNPHLRDVPDFQHMLWDQIFIISDFQLDADSPYPKLTREELTDRPEPLAYPQNHPKYRFYGNNIKRMIDVAKSWDEGEKKEGLILTIANHMKKCYLNWNRDTVSDEVIFDHLYVLSDGAINLRNADEDLSKAADLVKNKKQRHHSGSSRRGGRSSNRGRKRH